MTPSLSGPTAWLFGPEAHGLPAELAAMGDAPGADPDAGERREPQYRIGRRDLPVSKCAGAPSGLTVGTVSAPPLSDYSATTPFGVVPTLP